MNDGIPSDTQVSNATLGTVVKLLQSNNVPIAGYVPSSNVAVDRDGEIYWTTLEGVKTVGIYFDGK
jgi:hypothetical protein